ncbi:glycosyltransferase family 8 protein [Clostridium tetanomorphum]|uniref:glycosyltransferase family 8 protein n=2 Tax=Clostridium tetanomorphum TaxID=1553 RepID=UPI001F4BFBBF|nr:glycosyltransferase family 8 protein [Clostridium tetanomorphum]MBP1863028.1 lipopolysaccharide biosynthesis glycosyltransferase [Clostridium tetanomorphum]
MNCNERVMIMNVLYTCDNNYIWIMGISMISLFENNKAQKRLNVYLLGDCISEDNKKILQMIATKYERKCFIIDVPKLDIPEVLISQRWPISAFTRLFSGQLLPIELDRILYLDCDTIIEGDISPLDNFDMQGKVLCGIKDCIGKTYKQNIGLPGDGLYVNAGVLLLDLNKLREIDILKEIKKYLNKYTSIINYADQDILNGVFSSVAGVLSPEYNVMTLLAVYSYEDVKKLRFPTNFYTKKEVENAVKHSKIIHYTTCMLNVRPWFSNSRHPYVNEFAKYKAISPWADVELTEFKFKSKVSKVVAIVQKLPYCLAIRILGLIHAELKPLYIRVKANLNK